MKVLVTGAHGFIGRYIIQRLIRNGHTAISFDHQQADALAREWPAGVEVFLGDVRDDVAVTEAAAHADGIIHLAAVLGTAETIGNPRPAAHTNVIGSLNVFEAANQYGLPVAYAAVGNAWMRSQGGGTYTITKTCAEDFTKMFNMHRGGKINVVRPVNAYGPGQSVAAPYGASKVRKVMPAFICRALSGHPIEVYGDGTQVSDMVYVTDVAGAFVHALEHAAEGKIWQEPAEIGPAKSHTVNDIAQMVANHVAETTDTKPVEVRHIPMRAGEVPNSVVAANVETMTNVGIDYENFIPLEHGILYAVDYFNRKKGITWQPQR